MTFEAFMLQWLAELVLFQLGGAGVILLVALTFTAVMHYGPPWGHDEE